MSGPAVIAGLGEIPPRPMGSGRTAEDMTLRAAESACADAGIPTTEVDAILRYSHDTAMSLMAVAANLRCAELRAGAEVSYGGGSGAALLGLAEALVASGAASTVLCQRTIVGEDWVNQMNRPDEARLHYLDTLNYLRPVGWTGYLHTFAAMYWEHAAAHGTTREALGNVAVQLRANAGLNEDAACREPLTLEDYLAHPARIGPFGPFDDFAPGDVACAVIVTDAERARSLRGGGPVAEIAATAQSHKDAPMAWFDTRPLSPGPTGTPANVARALYRSSGMTPADIDSAHLYDCTTFTFLALLEEVGLRGPGEAAALVAQEGSLGATGSCPANTNGGDLAGGYSHGFRHILEAARQLTGRADNQVPDAETSLVMGAPVGPTSGAILRRLELA